MPAASKSANSSKATLTMPSDRELVITRIFNAPRDLVWKALTEPEHVKQWYGLRAFETHICEIDLRVGGKWRWGQRTPDGDEVVFSGEYREISPPSRLVTTEAWEAMPDHGYVATLTLDEHDGKTTYTNHLLYQSKEDRDGHVASGMEPGLQETLDRLDELVSSMS
ncbi:MAG: SRPBCC family protein [Haloechinothrix sp.]